jgi:hypothetical protein
MARAIRESDGRAVPVFQQDVPAEERTDVPEQVQVAVSP